MLIRKKSYDLFKNTDETKLNMCIILIEIVCEHKLFVCALMHSLIESNSIGLLTKFKLPIVTYPI